MGSKYVLKELSRYNLDTYADIIYRNALLYSEKAAFTCGSRSLSFSDFNQKVNQLIAALQAKGIKKGEVVGILSWNCLEYAVVYGAAMKGGFIASAFNPRLKMDELEYIINYSKARALFVGPQLMQTVKALGSRLKENPLVIGFEDTANDVLSFQSLIQNHPQSEPDILVEKDDPLFLFYTSGTTGVPRGALYTHIRAMEDTRRAVIALGIQPEDKQVQIMPLFHIGGTKNFWAYFFVGAENNIMQNISFDPEETLRTLEKQKATDIHIVPTHLAAFLGVKGVEQYDLSSLKRMFYAASPMPVALLKKGLELWGPIFVQFYGATEDGPNVLVLSKSQHTLAGGSDAEISRLASAGFPHIGVHVRIVDTEDQDVAPGEVGELIVSSNSVMKEWWGNPEKTRETIVDGWVHTGDLGRYDEKGFIYIVDRKKDMIISGGENIFPREIEEILYRHPAVKEAAVIGLPDPYWVEVGCAVIALKEGQKTTSEEIIGFCKKRLAGYKVPKSVTFVTSLPKNPAGKILKRELREIFKKNELKAPLKK